MSCSLALRCLFFFFLFLLFSYPCLFFLQRLDLDLLVIFILRDLLFCPMFDSIGCQWPWRVRILYYYNFVYLIIPGILGMVPVRISHVASFHCASVQYLIPVFSKCRQRDWPRQGASRVHALSFESATLSLQSRLQMRSTLWERFADFSNV